MAELKADGKVSRQDPVCPVGGGVQPHQQVRRCHQRLPLAPSGGRRQADDQAPTLVFPGQSNGRFVKVQDLRYGENPHQQAAFYRDCTRRRARWSPPETVAGQGTLYNNIADADAAWECVKSFDTPACVIVKHANPCGVAVGANALEAYSKAFQTDPTSAFGGIIALNRTAGRAPPRRRFQAVRRGADGAGLHARARWRCSRAKVNVRILQIDLPAPRALPLGRGRLGPGPQPMDIKRIGSGLLMQTADNHELTLADLKVVTKLQPTAQQLQDLLFAWKVAKYVKSNAIVFCKDGMTMGVGAGQMSRLDSARIASIKAGHANLSLAGHGGGQRRVLPVPRRPGRGVDPARPA
jgi:phosphoribosylaminoimidazolecarboxamide formyltransferase/IMP cyclohydrolase